MDIMAHRNIFYHRWKHSYNYQKIYIKNQETAPRHTVEICDRGYPCASLYNGSMTVEASLCVPIFFLVLFAYLYVFVIMSGQLSDQKELAEAAWNYENYGTKAASLVTMAKSSGVIRWDEEKDICYINKKQGIPYIGSNLFKVSIYQQICISDYQGESMVPVDRQESDTYVYITDNGRVYHLDRNCTYIKPEVNTVFFSEIFTKRNSSGGKYYPCEECAKRYNFSGGDSVFITPYGNRYHRNSNCSKIERNPRRVKISEIGNLPACSKCGK